MSPSLCTLVLDDQSAAPSAALKEPMAALQAADASATAATTSAPADAPTTAAPAPPSPPPSPGLPPAAVPLHRPPSMCAPAAAGTAANGAATAVDWSRVRLGVDAAPTMFVASWSPDTGRWDGGELVPYGPLSLLPAAQVLNYGQSIFEGLKAYRYDGPEGLDGGGSGGAEGDGAATAAGADYRQRQRHRVLLFRPDANAARFEAGAARMCMPPVPPAMFLAAVQAVVRANADWVPPASRGSLYLRPLLLGTGPLLGLCPAPSYTFLVYAVPVGGRAKGGRLTALDYLIHDSLHRAAPRGVGSTKAAGNYSPCLKAQAEARAAGCHDCIYLDARSDTYLEEGSGCNVFTTRGSVVTTPPAAGSILPGITRQSLLTLAAALGYRVREAPITVADAMRADEMFASGTAVVVQPIGSVTYKGHKVQFSCGAAATAANGTGSATLAEPSLATNGRPAGSDGGRRGRGAHSSSSYGSSSSEAEPEEEAAGPEEEEAAAAADEPNVAFGGGKSEGDLMPEERAALAAAAPVPEPGSLPPGVGPLAQRLYGLLTAIQYGRAPDVFGWTLEVDMSGPAVGALHLDQLLGEEEEEEERKMEPVAAVADGVVPERSAAMCGGAGAKGKGPAAAVPPPRTVFADPNLE